MNVMLEYGHSLDTNYESVNKILFESFSSLYTFYISELF